MYAVVATSGKQYRVEEGDTLVVDRVDAEVGATIEFDQVLLVGGADGGAKVGSPVVTGAVVKGEVSAHTQGDKRETFHFKRRKRSRVRKGSRPAQTEVRITEISA